MAGRAQGHDDSYEDDNYSDDFDDDATEGGGKRYKTRSPILRSDKRPSVVSESGTSEYIPLKSKTYRKSLGRASQGSGYHTPPSHKSQDEDDTEYYTPRSRVTADDVLTNPKPGKQSSLRAVSEYTPRAAGQPKHRSHRGRGRGRGGRMTGRMSTESKTDNITKRVMSARRLKINELHNTNSESQQVIKDLKEEIKLLKKTANRQDKALQRFEDRESDLPQLIQRQNNETRSLRDQIRKWREKYEKTDRYLRDAEDELEKAKSKLKKLKTLADEKDLPERADLNKKLNDQEIELEAKDVKIRELERYIQNLEKNHRHELGIERARQKDIKKQFQTIEEENKKLATTVEEKTKEIQMKNIYANRMTKPPHRLPNSYNGTPQGTPPPRKRRPSLSGADGITPRERAKQMEEKRREELRKQRELKQKNKRNRPDSYVSDYSSPSRKPPTHTPKIHGGGGGGGTPSTRHRPTPRTTQELSPYISGEQQEKARRDQELRKRQEQEDRERADMERQEQERQLRDKERALNEDADRDEEDRRLREERERMKRQSDDKARTEREKREREERERRKQKEREERERKERREREERERRERERLEQERRAQEERRRFEDDTSIQAERKKKEEILQKLREIDEGVQKQREKAKINDPFFVTEAKESSQDSIASSQKSYKFTKPTENLHKGKPSHKVNGIASPSKTSNRRRGDDDIDTLETGGYNPTFASKPGGLSLFDDEPKPSKSNKPANKSKLMADLFGSSEPPARQDEIFGSPQPKKSEPSTTRPSFLFDDDTSKSRNNIGAKRENSATLFGGGSALVNDEDIFSKPQQRSNAGITRRPKQTTTAFHSRPTVNAIDQFDDDIEEVML